LEAVWWRRIVLDEFHESASWTLATRECMKACCSGFRWGLSGTPPLSNTELILEVADLLHYPALEQSAETMREWLQMIKKWGKEQVAWRECQDNQAALRTCAQLFLIDVVRQNTSALVESIQVMQHEEFVEHTAEERVIYRQACHDNGVFDLKDGYDEVGLNERAALLQRCAHFSIDTEVQSSEAAVKLLGESKRERIRALEQQLMVEACRAAAFDVWPQCSKALRSMEPLRHSTASQYRASVLAMSEDHLRRQSTEVCAVQVRKEMLDQHGFERQRPEVHLDQPVKDTEGYMTSQQRHLILHEVARRTDPEADSCLSELAICEHTCHLVDAQRLADAMISSFAGISRLLDGAHRSLDFYTWQLQGLSSDQNAEEHVCSICHEAAGHAGAKVLAILPCSHVFHTSCAYECVKKAGRCPLCTEPVNRDQINSVVMELQPSVAPTAAPTHASSQALRAHGSKLNVVAQRVKDIRVADTEAKVIVFLQWPSLEDRISAAFGSHGIPCLRIQKGSRHARAATETLKQFQEQNGVDDPYVLLLSLDHAASGTNLTSANHIVFIHPMNADTMETAVAYERQALGRIRRVGQLRSTVTIWRFVAKATVEEHVHRLHKPLTAEA